MTQRHSQVFEAGGKLWEFNRISVEVINGIPRFQRKTDEIVELDKSRGTFHTLIT